jgi:hypothetical protein
MPSLPTPFRAALGVVAVARDTVQNLPDKAFELPMLVVSTALQMSLRAQQRYAALAARGDDLLAGQRTTDAPPPWARFDDLVEPSSPEAASLSDARRRSSEANPDDAGKTVHLPRTGTPSAFDAAED